MAGREGLFPVTQEDSPKGRQEFSCRCLTDADQMPQLARVVQCEQHGATTGSIRNTRGFVAVLPTRSLAVPIDPDDCPWKRRSTMPRLCVRYPVFAGTSS